MKPYKFSNKTSESLNGTPKRKLLMMVLEFLGFSPVRVGLSCAGAMCSIQVLRDMCPAKHNHLWWQPKRPIGLLESKGTEF